MYLEILVQFGVFGVFAVSWFLFSLQNVFVYYCSCYADHKRSRALLETNINETSSLIFFVVVCCLRYTRYAHSTYYFLPTNFYHFSKLCSCSVNFASFNLFRITKNSQNKLTNFRNIIYGHFTNVLYIRASHSFQLFFFVFVFCFSNSFRFLFFARPHMTSILYPIKGTNQNCQFYYIFCAFI